jgi:hypothetical protein
MTPDTAAIDTLANDRFALCSLVAHTNTTFISGNPPAGWTADSNQGTASGTGANSAIISKTQAAAGNVPSVEVGTYSANVVTAQLTLAFLPTVSAYTAAPTDTITLSDSPVKQVGAVKGDTLTLSDIEINTLILGLLLADTITLSDSDSEIIGLALTDSLVLSDARLSAIGLITADSLSLNDALSQLVGLVKADTLTLTDVATPVLIGAGGGLSLLLGDTIILSDAKVLGPLFFSVE